MAYFYSEKTNSLYDDVQKTKTDFRTFERDSYERVPVEDCVPYYKFYKTVTKKIVSVNYYEPYFLQIKDKLKPVDKAFFDSKLSEWKNLENVDYQFTGSSASDDWGSVRAAEIDADNYS